MGEDNPAWVRGILGGIDKQLRTISQKAKKTLRLLRVTLAFLIIFDVAIVAAAAISIWRPEYTPYALAVVALAALIPIVAITALVALPLRMKSVTSLVDKGYPANAKELAIRIAARKMRNQSIETEEMLFETAWNESRKMLRKYQARARRMQEEDATNGNSAPTPSGSSTETLRPQP